VLLCCGHTEIVTRLSIVCHCVVDIQQPLSCHTEFVTRLNIVCCCGHTAAPELSYRVRDSIEYSVLLCCGDTAAPELSLREESGAAVCAENSEMFQRIRAVLRVEYRVRDTKECGVLLCWI